MKTCFSSFLSLLTLVLALAVAVPAHSSVMVLDINGTLSSTTTLNNIPLGADTLFTLHAVFDTTALLATDTQDPMTIAWYAATNTLTLSGHAPLNGTVPVILLSAIVPGVFTLNAAGIAPVDINQTNYLDALSASPNPFFYPLTPIPSDLNSGIGGDAQGTLVFGSDTLGNLSYGSPPSNAVISVGATAVPEPSTYALLCISLGVVGYARKRMVKRV